MFAEARSLAGRTGTYRPLLQVAINESHVLEGMGEHERAARVARAGIASARDYGLARSTGTFLAINVAEPLVSLGRWDEADRGHRACPRALPATAQPARCCGSWLVPSRCAAATWPTRGH